MRAGRKRMMTGSVIGSRRSGENEDWPGSHSGDDSAPGPCCTVPCAPSDMQQLARSLIALKSDPGEKQGERFQDFHLFHDTLVIVGFADLTERVCTIIVC